MVIVTSSVSWNGFRHSLGHVQLVAMRGAIASEEGLVISPTVSMTSVSPS